MNQSRDNKSNKSADAASLEAGDLVERLKQSSANPAQFLADLLAAQCFLSQADCGAILRIGQNNDVEVLALYPPLGQDANAPDWLTRSAGFASDALSSNTMLIRSMDGSGQQSGRATQSHIVILPFSLVSIDKAVAAFVVRAKNKSALDASSRKLQLSIALLGSTGIKSAQQNWRESCKRLQRAMETLSAVNRQERFTGAAMTFCNEAASQWQCERVSIGFLKGKYVQIKAMSHTESFSRKMQVVQDIEAAMEECLDQDVEILSPANKEATYVGRAADKLSERYGALNILSFPLRRNGEVLGVLTLERPADRAFEPDEIETIRLTCELCSPRLVNLYEYARWIGATIAIKARNSLAELLGPKHTWIKIMAILCFAAILFLIFAKGQFRPDAPFVLEATYQQVVPAPFDGYIKHVDVEVGDMVEGGSSILGGLDTAELRLSLAAAKAEKVSYLKQASAAMRDGETAQAQIAQANADKVQAQIELLEYQIGQASLVSPIGGVVVKGDLKRQIGAPVQVGDVLFEVCPLESLRAQLMVPEDAIYDIKVGQEGYLATASYPGERIKFVVERINPVAEVVNQRNVFKVRVQLLETHSWMRPGMEGIAKVSVGKRRYVWIWTRKIVNWIRMKLWL
ncbi:MAG: HlyD family efflux transporter periplasmic adaptor subunit [Planctomycetota bacterium]|jgi:GAF domain-containing protein/biotin carboxyl carrier protein